MKLTKATVAKLKLPDGKTDAIFFDDDLKGFGIRLRSGGRKTWLVQYRVGARQRRLKLGNAATLDPDEARKAAKERLATVALGHDPQADKAEAQARAATTLGSVAEQFLTFKELGLRPNSLRMTRHYLRQSWGPLHALPIHEVSRRDVATRLAELVSTSGPVAASRARATLSGMFSWAVREGICENNVVFATNDPPQPTSRDRTLNDGEIADIWAACRNDDYDCIIRLMLLTSARREEVGGMAWSEIDLNRSLWQIPGARTKNHRTHVVPLPPMALAIIREVPHRKDNDYLFGEAGFNGWSHAKHYLDARIAEERRKAGNLEPMPAWWLHDLRRTCATVMADRLGIQPHIVEAVLNHVSGHKAGVAGTYNRAPYAAEKRTALSLWAEHVRTIIEDGERKVVPFREASSIPA